MKLRRFAPFFPWILYAAVVFLVFAPALTAPRGFMLFGDDINRTYYFYREFFLTWLRRGVWPWWNPYLFGGEPFIANPIVNIWYPANWLYVLLPLPIAFTTHIMFHIWWAMAGMYVLLSRVLEAKGKRSVTGAWVGGVVFGLSGFFMARTYAGHVDVIAAASWMPWVVWGFYKLLSARDLKWANVLRAAGIFALQLFSGYQTMAFFTVIAVGMMTVFSALRTRSVRPFVRSAIAGIFGVGLAALQILPAAEFFRASIRTYSLPYSWISYGSWAWQSLLQFFNPWYFGSPVTYHGPPPNFIEHSAFVGIGGLILAVFGVFALRKASTWKWMGIGFAAVTLFGIWVSLGPNAPLDLQYLLWKAVPMYHYLRIPPRHLILVVFGLSGLAGLGLSSWKLHRAITVGIAAMVTVELIVFARVFITVRPVPGTLHDKELVRILTADREPYRVLQNSGVWVPPRDRLDFDSTASYGIFSATGYDPSIYRPYYEFVANASGQKGSDAVLSQDVQVPYLTPASADAIDALNIKYIIVPVSADPFGGAGGGRYEVLYHDPDHDAVVYENKTAKPRFYFQDSVSRVRVVSYTPNAVTLEVNSEKDQTLASSEVYYPGWRAYIDGKNADIQVTNGVFRTLFVPAGKHTVVYRYVPYVFVIGAFVSLGSAVLLGILSVIMGKRGR